MGHDAKKAEHVTQLHRAISDLVNAAETALYWAVAMQNTLERGHENMVDQLRGELVDVREWSDLLALRIEDLQVLLRRLARSDG